MWHHAPYDRYGCWIVLCFDAWENCRCLSCGLWSARAVMNVGCNAGFLPRELIYQGKATSANRFPRGRKTQSEWISEAGMCTCSRRLFTSHVWGHWGRTTESSMDRRTYQLPSRNALITTQLQLSDRSAGILPRQLFNLLDINDENAKLEWHFIFLFFVFYNKPAQLTKRVSMSTVIHLI